MKNWKKPSKVGFFSIVEEIFINAVAVQTPLKAKSRTTRSLLIQDWGAHENEKQQTFLVYFD